MWPPNIIVYEVDYSRVGFHIQIHGVPLEGFTTNNAARIASKVGEVIKVENPIVEHKIIKGFLRARVLIDITKPLSIDFLIPVKDFLKVWAPVR